MEAIESKSLKKIYKSRTAVDNLSLSVADGEFFGLLGQNGAGKTTTIKMLCGLTPPSEGDAYLYGKSVTADTAVCRAMINVSPQETAVAPSLSVRENLELTARLWGASASEARARAAVMMESLSLADRADERAKTLSGGYGRRLSIAMALITEPRILFLDEPTLGLDVRARRELWRFIAALKGKITIVLTTNYLEEAEALCDRIAVLSEGRLKAVGTPGELIAASGAETFEDAFIALTESEVDGGAKEGGRA